MAPIRRTWTITRHALDRFVERFDPESSDDEAMARLNDLLEDAVEIGHRDTGTPEERGVLLGTPKLHAAAFLCRPDAFHPPSSGRWVCVTTLDSRAHQHSFRGTKEGRGGPPRRGGRGGGRARRR